MELFKGFGKTIIILIAFLFFVGNSVYAENFDSIVANEETQVIIKEFNISKGNLDTTFKETTEDPGITTNSHIQRIIKMGVGGGSGSSGGKYRPPQGKFIDEKKANSFAQRFDYDDAHDMKETLLKGQKDTVGAHYNIYQVTKKGTANGDVYLNHRSTNTWYKTIHNYYRPTEAIPISPY